MSIGKAAPETPGICPFSVTTKGRYCIAAITLEYPFEHLQLVDKRWPVERLASGLLVGLLSLGLAAGLGQWLSRRRNVTAAAA